jgi:hypothetical protein
VHDLFISHASEDKETVARPLTLELQRRGYTVWLDQFELRLGDSLSRTIDRGLAESRYGAVILSKYFFAKRWPERELTGLVSREMSSGAKVILPIWHEVSHADVLKYSPSLADRLSVSTSLGLSNVADEIAAVLGAPLGPHVNSSRDAASVVTHTAKRKPPPRFSRLKRSGAFVMVAIAFASGSASVFFYRNNREIQAVGGKVGGPSNGSTTGGGGSATTTSEPASEGKSLPQLGLPSAQRLIISTAHWNTERVSLNGSGFGRTPGTVRVEYFVYKVKFQASVENSKISTWTNEDIEFSWPDAMNALIRSTHPQLMYATLEPTFIVTTIDGHSTEYTLRKSAK